MNAIARLGRFVRGKETAERCGLCASTLEAGHAHVVQVDSGKLHCSCAGCANVLGHATSKFRRVPDRVLPLPELILSPEEWNGFGVPVGIAFFVQSTPRAEAVAFYPSPLGPVQTGVPGDAWERLLERNPILATLAPDVEALLVRREATRAEAWLVPLDECYRLTALVRTSWRGFTGGEALAGTVEGFFRALGERVGGAR